MRVIPLRVLLSQTGVVADCLQRALGEAFGPPVLNVPLFPLFRLRVAMAFTVHIVPLTIGSARSDESFIKTTSIEDVLNYSKSFGCGDYKKPKCDEEATQLLKCFFCDTHTHTQLSLRNNK